MELTSSQKKIIVITSLAVIALALIILLVRLYNTFLGANLGMSDQENVQTFSGVLNTDNFELGENWITFNATDANGETITAQRKFNVVNSTQPYGGGEDPDPYGGEEDPDPYGSDPDPVEPPPYG